MSSSKKTFHTWRYASLRSIIIADDPESTSRSLFSKGCSVGIISILPSAKITWPASIVVIWEPRITVGPITMPTLLSLDIVFCKSVKVPFGIYL